MKINTGNKLGLGFSRERVPKGKARDFHQSRHVTDGVGGSTRVADQHLALMSRTGLRAAEMAWALNISIGEIEVRLKNLAVQLGGEFPAAQSVSGATHQASAISWEGKPPLRSDHVMPDPDRPARPPLLDRAVRALGGRIVLVRDEIYLDGNSANFRDLVVAAAAEGVEIHYPGLRPLAAAFHPGPSKSGGRRRTKAPPSLMSVHVPY